jgi:probable rRNA maturation factor
MRRGRRREASGAARSPAARLRLAVTDRGKPRTPLVFVRRVVRAVLAFGKRPDLAVSLLLTDDREIAALHARHLGDATTTDVMSFAADDDDGDGGVELVVSVQTARRVARERGHEARAEIALYIVHGLLHVLGHDDKQPRARARMRLAEQQCMRRLALVVADVDD